MQAIMEYGSSDALNWLFSVYKKHEIIDFVLNKGSRYLSNKSLSYYKVILDIPDQEWKQVSSQRRNNPFLAI